MEPNDLLATLLEEDVLEETQAGIQTTESFRASLANRRTVLTADDGALRADKLAATTADEQQQRLLLAAGQVDPDFLARFVLLDQTLESPATDTVIQLAVTLAHVERGFPRTEGSPDTFFPIYADQLEPLLTLSPQAIVYVWRDDCPPCDQMAEAFDELAPGWPDELALLAVYGPDDPEYLRREYNVGGGPTTLFCLGGRVDARLLGSHPTATIQSEVQKLRMLS